MKVDLGEYVSVRKMSTYESNITIAMTLGVVILLSRDVLH